MILSRITRLVACSRLQEPVYLVSLTPAGTPVLPGPGQQPPCGSAPPGVSMVPEQLLLAAGGGLELPGGGGELLVVGLGRGLADEGLGVGRGDGA
jgi:hypothetical protein